MSAVRSVGARGPRTHGSRSTLVYGALAFGWAWSFWFLLAAAPGLPAPLPLLLHLTGGLGPLLGAAWVLRSGGSAHRRRFLQRVWDPRGIPAAWWVALVGVTLGPATVGAAAAGLVGATATAPDRGLSVVAATAAFAMAAGVVEEPGWRGVVTDLWRGRLRPVWLALGIGVVWAMWHLPLYLVEGSYQHDLGLGSLRFWLTSLVLVELSVLYVWLVEGTGGRIVFAVLAHAGFNLAGELVPRSVTGDVVAFLVVTAATLIVIVSTRGHLGARSPGAARTQRRTAHLRRAT